MNPWLAFFLGYLTSPTALIVWYIARNNQSGEHRHYGRHDYNDSDSRN